MASKSSGPGEGVLMIVEDGLAGDEGVSPGISTASSISSISEVNNGTTGMGIWMSGSGVVLASCMPRSYKS